MKLLLTNHELDAARGGTQIFIMDLAQELRSRGHEVAVYTPRPGPLAEELTAAGVPVVKIPRECGFVPDVIHGQHHLATMTALCAFPGVPAVYHCHGYGPWEELPPVHPRIRRYIAMAGALTKWMAGVVGRKAEEIVVLPNTVHLGRFQKVRRLGLHARRALVFGNGFIPGELLSKLRKACARCEMTLDFLGAAYGNAAKTPQDILPDYDVVFAVGRCALEAMASGCAVVPFSSFGIVPMIQPETLKYLVKMNFALPEMVDPVTVTMIEKYLREFDAGRAAAVTDAIRSEASFAKACDRLVDLYSQVKEEQISQESLSGEELRAMTVYLDGLARHVGNADQRYAGLLHLKDLAWFRSGKLKNKLSNFENKYRALEQKHSALEQRWERMKGRLPQFLQRWLLRGLE